VASFPWGFIVGCGRGKYVLTGMACMGKAIDQRPGVLGSVSFLLVQYDCPPIPVGSRHAMHYPGHLSSVSWRCAIALDLDGGNGVHVRLDHLRVSYYLPACILRELLGSRLSPTHVSVCDTAERRGMRGDPFFPSSLP